MSTLRVNQVYFNDAGNATISIANSWNVSIVSGGQEVAQFRNNGDFVANNRIVYRGGGSTEVAINTMAELAFSQSNTAQAAAVAAFNQANTANTTAASAGVYPGGIMYWASDTPPTGFLPCDGNIYTRSTYSALASVLGTPPMISSYTVEYANTTALLRFTQSSMIGTPTLASANGLLFLSPYSLSGGNVAALGNLYTSTDGSTWTPRTASAINVYWLNNYRPGGPNSNENNTYSRYKNNTLAASNGASGPYIVMVGGSSNSIVYQTSVDQGATWTLRSREYYRPNTNFGVYSSGVVAGGTANAYLMGAGIYYLYSTCCTSAVRQSEANVAWSADGLTFTSFKSLNIFTGTTDQVPQTIIVPTLAASPNGFVALISPAGGTGSANLNYANNNATVFWSANGHPSTWTDITANLKATLGLSASAQTGPVFLNVYACNNEIIIPSPIGNKFLVTSNGANGTWRTVKYEGGLRNGTYKSILPDGYTGSNLFADLFNQAGFAKALGLNGFASVGNWGYIVHNGDAYILQDAGSNIQYSKDLRVWWQKDDINVPINSNPSSSAYTYVNYLTTLPALKKVLMSSAAYTSVYSFTTTGAYTAATQFPVPEIPADIAVTRAFSTSAVPLRAFIKT